MTEQTPEQIADARTRDVMAFAYRDTDGKLYTVNQAGERVEAPATVPALSPEYQAIAERTAALVISYDKILDLTPQERGVLVDLASGKRQVDETLSSGLREAWNSLRSATRDSGVTPNIPGLGLVTDTAGLASGTLSGLSFIPNLLSDISTLGSDVRRQFGGGHISRENAIAIGTAYASARQVAAAGRPLEPGVGDFFKGLFSSHFLSYAGAGLAWLLDTVVGFAENIPGIGDWIKQQGWASHQTLAQHIETNMRDDDNVRVAHEIGELDRLGGQNAAQVATLLTTGGTVRDGAGAAQNVNPADSENANPTGPGGADAPTTPDAALAAAAANQRPLGQRLYDAVSNADFSATAGVVAEAGPLGVAGGTAIAVGGAYQYCRGVREGANRQPIRRAATTASRLTEEVNSLTAEIEAARNGTRSGWQFWRSAPSAEEITAMQARLDVLKAEAVSAGQRAELLSNTASRSARAGAEGASWWNVPRNLGRASGELGASTVHHLTRIDNSITARIERFTSPITSRLEPYISPIRDRVSGWFGRSAEAAPEAAHTATGNVGKAAHAAHAAEEVAEAVAHAEPAVARSAGMLSRVGATLSRVNAGRFSGIFKFLGITAVGAAAIIPATAMANTGEAIATGDHSEARIRGTETAAYGAVAATALRAAPAAVEAAPTAFAIGRIALGRVAAGAAPIMETANLASGIAHHDQRKINDAGINLATIGAFTAGGAALGLAGGPFAPISVPAGAVGGMFVGGLVTAGRSIYNMFTENSSPQVAAAPATPRAPARPATVPQPAPLTAQELAQAHSTAIDQARMAVNRGRSSGPGFDAAAFARVSTTAMGAVNNPPAPAGGARPQTIHLNV